MFLDMFCHVLLVKLRTQQDRNVSFTRSYDTCKHDIIFKLTRSGMERQGQFR